jgi:hypothetical protein
VVRVRRGRGKGVGDEGLEVEEVYGVMPIP